MCHAATALCWLRTATIFRQPAILRNLIGLLATRLTRGRRQCCQSAGEPASPPGGEGGQEPNARSFDDVIRPQQQQRRDREAERLRRLEVDDQF